MIRRVTSLNRVVDEEGGPAEQSSHASLSRRRSPVARGKAVYDASPPASPRRGRSPSPSRLGNRGWPRGGGTGNFRSSPREVFIGMVSRGGGSTGGGLPPKGGDRGGGSDSPRSRSASKGKGPKGSDGRVVPWRQMVALLAVGLCMVLVAGGRRIIGFPQGDPALEQESIGGSPPTLRGIPRRHKGGLAEVLASGETKYCNAPLDYPSAQRPSSRRGEGQVGSESGGGDGDAGLVLRQLQVTIRHGDRSAIHDLPNADEKRWRCLPFSKEIQSKWEGVSRFSISNVDGKPLDRSLMPAVYAEEELGQLGKEAGLMCKQGQLTEIGVRQHLTLGGHMRKAYHDLLGGELAADEIYVRSTDYTRTLESAAAFLTSFFPGSSAINIFTNQNEEEEVMHGIGLKAIGSEHGGTGEEENVVGACNRAAKLTSAQVRQFKPRADVISDLRDLFGEEVLDLKMTSIADSMHALSCHNMTLPCSEKGCVSANLALSVMSEADRQLCMKYNGAAGGGEASTLSLYPFTNEILTNMRQALSGETAVKFALFSGHDTVIAPLLAALGAYDCRWPPYASHVAFELWSKPSKGGRGGGGSGSGGGKDRYMRALKDGPSAGGDGDLEADRKRVVEEGAGGHDPEAGESGGQIGEEDSPADGGNPPGAGTAGSSGEEGLGSSVGGEGIERGEAAAKMESVEGGREEEEAFVRVTFQGQPVTHRITDCGGDPLQGPYGREFCPLSQFAKTIARALGGHDTLEEACKERR